MDSEVLPQKSKRIIAMNIILAGSRRKETSAGPFSVEFACSSRACMGFFQVLQLPPTIQRLHVTVRLTGGSKLPVVIVSVHGCLFTCGPDGLVTCPGGTLVRSGQERGPNRTSRVHRCLFKQTK